MGFFRSERAASTLDYRYTPAFTRPPLPVKDGEGDTHDPSPLPVKDAERGYPGPAHEHTTRSKHADIKELSFERALKELETIVSRLERGDVELEESITIYERGEALRDHCDRLLKQAEAKVEKLTFAADGTPKGTEPLDP